MSEKYPFTWAIEKPKTARGMLCRTCRTTIPEGYVGLVIRHEHWRVNICEECLVNMLNAFRGELMTIVRNKEKGL